MLGPPFLLFAFVRFSMIPLPLLNERTFWMTPIDVKKSYESIGSKGAKALLSYHAFSGGDFTCKFNGKSKLTTWRHLNSSSDAVLDAFSQLGSPDVSILDETTADVCYEFVLRKKIQLHQNYRRNKTPARVRETSTNRICY